MVPDTAIISISADKTLKDALEVFCIYQFTRIPVYENHTDNIIGMLHQKDLLLLLSKNQEKSIKEIVRPHHSIPEKYQKVIQLLKEFREQRMHIAMVINEIAESPVSLRLKIF